MSEKKKSKRRKDEYTGPGGAENEIQKATKQEIKVAKWIKNNVPTKKTKFLNHNVSYFTATKALDALMNSKFAQGDDCLFPTRESAIDFLDTMLIHKFFHRAKKVPVSEAELRRGKKNLDKEKEDDSGNGKSGGNSGDVRKRKETKKDDKIQQQEGIDSGKDTKDKDKDKDKDKEKDKEKKKRKIRLDMHPDQVFVDGSEAYVWIYDPIPIHYWIMGTLFVIGAILVCLFPLWPPLLRQGVYYLSLVAAGLLVFILGLAVLRFIIFCIVWVVTGAKHHFWLLPNLTEDVGFFASFWPIYSHETQDDLKSKSEEKNKKRKKEKDSDVEEDLDMSITYLDAEKIENVKEHDAEIPLEHLRYTQNESEHKNEKQQFTEIKEVISELSTQSSESEPEGTQLSENSKSSSRTSCENFEIIDMPDVNKTIT